MKKIAGLTFLWILMVGMVSGWAQTPLNILTLEFPPYAYTENDEIKGFAVELVREAFDRMDVAMEIHILPWARSIRYLQDGDADGLFAMIKTDERATFADYPENPLVYENRSFFVHKDSDITFDGNLQELREYQIGDVRGFSHGEQYDNAVKEGVLTNIDYTNFNEQNVKKLVNNRLDLIISDKYIVWDLLRQMDAQGTLKHLYDLEQIPSYLAFSKKRHLTGVITRFDQAMTEMKADGTYDRIITEFFGHEASNTP